LNPTIIQVDAFTNRPFAGNPAAVCVLDEPAPERWMQHVAREMNLSETAFLHPIDGGSRYRLRWFTPAVEVDLCGHATLASAHVLWQDGRADDDAPIEFETRSGMLAARRDGDWIELNFPAEPVDAMIHDADELDRIASALGCPVVAAGLNRFDLLVELADEQSVRSLQPDFDQIETIPVRGVIATSLSSDPDFDFVSRFFAPQLGVDEDPVCGSAHCCSGPYWASRVGRRELVGHQVSPRGGVVKVRLEGDRRVALIGQAVTVFKGELLGVALV